MLNPCMLSVGSFPRAAHRTAFCKSIKIGTNKPIAYYFIERYDILQELHTMVCITWTMLKRKEIIMKIIYYNLKPFIIFQAVIVFIDMFYKLANPQSDAWVIVSYGILLPYYSGGIYIIGALFGAWIQFRSESKLKIIICNNIFVFFLILFPIAILFQIYTLNIFLIALYQFLCFIGGQIILLTLEFLISLYELIKKKLR